MATLAGTDQEGTVLTIEHGAELVYRVKSKSPDYLRLLRLLVHCNYAATAAMLDAFAEMPTWPAFKAILQTQGTDKVPEEVLGLYREHYERFEAYRHDVGRLRDWALAQCAEVKASIEGIDDLRLRRKSFAERVKTLPHTALLFSAFDGRLDSARVRQYAATPEEMSAALEPMPND